MRILFKTNYKQDLNLAKHSGHRFWYGLLILVLFAAPLILGGYYIGEATRILIYAMAGLGLMVLTGFTGQVSLGHAAFLAIGAYIVDNPEAKPHKQKQQQNTLIQSP